MPSLRCCCPPNPGVTSGLQPSSPRAIVIRPRWGRGGGALLLSPEPRGNVGPPALLTPGYRHSPPVGGVTPNTNVTLSSWGVTRVLTLPLPLPVAVADMGSPCYRRVPCPVVPAGAGRCIVVPEPRGNVGPPALLTPGYRHSPPLGALNRNGTSTGLWQPAMLSWLLAENVRALQYGGLAEDAGMVRSGPVGSSRELGIVRTLFGAEPVWDGLGWALVEVKEREALWLRMERGGEVVEFWMVGDDPGVRYYKRTKYFLVGYSGEAAASGVELVDRMVAQLSAREPELGRDVCQRVLNPHGSADEPKLLGEVIEIRLTHRCNEACPFCNSSRWAENQFEGVGEVETAIRSGVGLGARSVAFTGGEPSLVPELPRYVRLARSLGLDVEVQTNGILVGDVRWWERFRAPDGLSVFPNRLLISLHTQHPERMKSLTGVAGTLERKLASATLAHQRGVRVGVNFVLSRLNLDELPDFPSFLVESLGTWPRLMISVAAATGRARNVPGLVLRIDEVAEPLQAALAAATAMGLNVVVPEGCGVPICAAPMFSGCFSASWKGGRGSLPPGNVKGLGCGGCAFSRMCSGVTAEYAAVFGTEGLLPVAGPVRSVSALVTTRRGNGTRGIRQRAQIHRFRIGLRRKTRFRCTLSQTDNSNR